MEDALVKIPIGSMTEDHLKELLRCRSAKAGITYEEIIGAYRDDRTARARGSG